MFHVWWAWVSLEHLGILWDALDDQGSFHIKYIHDNKQLFLGWFETYILGLMYVDWIICI